MRKAKGRQLDWIWMKRWKGRNRTKLRMKAQCKFANKNSAAWLETITRLVVGPVETLKGRQYSYQVVKKNCNFEARITYSACKKCSLKIIIAFLLISYPWFLWVDSFEMPEIEMWLKNFLVLGESGYRSWTLRTSFYALIWICRSMIWEFLPYFYFCGLNTSSNLILWIPLGVTWF